MSEMRGTDSGGNQLYYTPSKKSADTSIFVGLFEVVLYPIDIFKYLYPIQWDREYSRIIRYVKYAYNYP
jgi:hypothetical protein